MRLRLPLEGLCADDPVDRLPSGNVRPLSRYEAGFASPAGEDPLKAPLDALYKAPGGSGQAVLHDKASGLEVVYDADAEDLYWIIWNGDAKSGFVAIEPQPGFQTASICRTRSATACCMRRRTLCGSVKRAFMRAEAKEGI